MNGSIFAFKSQIPTEGKENVTASVAEQNYTPQANYSQKWQSTFFIAYRIGKNRYHQLIISSPED